MKKNISRNRKFISKAEKASSYKRKTPGKVYQTKNNNLKKMVKSKLNWK